MTRLMVTYDDGITTFPTREEVLNWRTWKQSEIEKINKVAAGTLRRFSTTYKGVPCDIELAE